MPAISGMLVDILLDLDFNLNEFSAKTDEELALLARNDKNAAAVLMSRYMKLISIKSEIFADHETDSDDLRQEGMLSLFRAIVSFDSNRGVKFSTYAEVCIVNRMRTISARSKKAPIRSDIISEENESEELSVEETPESIYLYKEFISELLNGMNTLLTPVEKSALELSMEGVSYRSAADKMGISEKSVDNAIQRARRKLRSLINKLNMTV